MRCKREECLSTSIHPAASGQSKNMTAPCSPPAERLHRVLCKNCSGRRLLGMQTVADCCCCCCDSKRGAALCWPISQARNVDALLILCTTAATVRRAVELCSGSFVGADAWLPCGLPSSCMSPRAGCTAVLLLSSHTPVPPPGRCTAAAGPMQVCTDPPSR